MTLLHLEKINKIYDGGYQAVKNFDLTVNENEFIVFVGPSGCGKSTTLRMIAGLEPISAGLLILDDEIINNADPSDRDVAMVFQNYALYPHMNVYDNMAFSLKMSNFSKAEIEKRVIDVATMLNLEPYLKRKPKQLSGGQRQRVALGRAIVRQPKLFLMDEPLSNLDAKLRVEMRRKIVELYKDLNIPFIYVTHDQVEAMTMGTKIVVMNEGEIQQVATPKEIFEKPKNQFVASFIGSPQMNFLKCKLSESSKGISLAIGEQELLMSMEEGKKLIDMGYTDKELTLGIRPEAFSINDMQFSSKSDKLAGIVEFSELNGAETYLHLDVEGYNIIANVSSNFNFDNNEKVNLVVDLEQIHLFDQESGLAIR